MATQKRIFLSICLISFIGPFMSSSVNVAIPAIAAGFGVLADTLSWIVTAFLIGTAAILLPLGKLSDLWGQRRTYTAGVLSFGIVTIAAGCAPSLFWLIFLRALQGLTLAAIYVSYMPILLASNDTSHQGRVIGTAVSMTYLGLSLGPFIGGFITQYAGWRFIFFLAAAIIAASYAAIEPVREEWYGSRTTFFNKTSSLLCASGITSFLYGLSTYTSGGAARPLLWAGLILIAAFIWHEYRTFHPMLPLYLFRNLTFAMSNLASLIQYSATYAISFLLSLYLQILLHLDAATTGLILLAQPIIMASLSIKTGTLADKYDPRYLASLGMACTTMSLAAFACLPDVTIEETLLLLVLTGLGAAFFGAPNNSAIMGSVPPQHHGTASSMLALSRMLGQAVSMAVVTLIFTHLTSLVTPYEAALRSSLHLSFIILAITCFFGILASLARGKGKHPVSEETGKEPLL